MSRLPLGYRDEEEKHVFGIYFNNLRPPSFIKDTHLLYGNLIQLDRLSEHSHIQHIVFLIPSNSRGLKLGFIHIANSKAMSLWA